VVVHIKGASGEVEVEYVKDDELGDIFLVYHKKDKRKYLVGKLVGDRFHAMQNT
tara:strand:- start:2119 stop:2280 length:162 start_codon:yes stop_codon:yes gene_type:complete